MNAPTYINNAHKALARNPGGLTLEELSGKLRAKALKVSQQIRELHDAGLIETTEDAGQPVYRLIVVPAEEIGLADIPAPDYDPASVAFPSAVGGLPTKTYSPAVLQSMIADLSSDSEGGETDAPAVDAQREEFSLLGLIADIRAAAGDPAGRLMQDELVQHIAGVVKERDDLRARIHAQIEQWQTDTGRLTTDLRAAMESRSQAINEADRLRAELATERQAREALQEQAGTIPAARRYLVVSGFDRSFVTHKLETARKDAERLARNTKLRADVFALIPVGSARIAPSVQWKPSR